MLVTFGNVINMQLTKEHILKSIAELLVLHDCVIIPGFGGFVATYCTAAIDASMHSIAPPSKKISFNSQLQGNDGLLANHLCKKLNINFVDADIAIKNLASELKQQLFSGNTVSFYTVGKLYINENQKIIFTPTLGANLLIDSFGLKHISLPKIKKQAIEIDTDAVETLVAESILATTEKSTKKPKSNSSVYALALVLIAILFVAQTLYTNAQKDNVPVQQLSFGDISSLVIPTKKQPATNIVSSFEIKRSYEIISHNTLGNTPNQPEIKEHITKVTTEDLPMGYYIIVGSFKSFDNANTARKSFNKKGYVAKIIPTENNYYRVGIYISEKVSDVNEQIASFRNKYQKQAWVMLSE